MFKMTAEFEGEQTITEGRLRRLAELNGVDADGSIDQVINAMIAHWSAEGLSLTIERVAD